MEGSGTYNFVKDIEMLWSKTDLMGIIFQRSMRARFSIFRVCEVIMIHSPELLDRYPTNILSFHAFGYLFEEGEVNIGVFNFIHQKSLH